MAQTRTNGNLMKPQKSDCPFWNNDQATITRILTWANATVEWSDTFINGLDEITHEPDFAHWSLSWEYGVIGFDGLTKDNQEHKIKAHAAASLFIYLWCKGIPANIAEQAATAHAHHYKIDGQ